MAATQGQLVGGFTCPQCKSALDDYAIQCPACGLDLLQNDPRPQWVLANSINRKEQSVFFNVSPVKLMIMSMVTFGFYEFFWSYKNWYYVSEHTNRKNHPFVRSMFFYLTSFVLLGEFQKAGKPQNIAPGFPLPLLGLLYLILQFGAPILIPVTIPSIGTLALLPAQRYINSLNKNTPTPINDKFTIANWIAIVIGGALNIFFIIRSLGISI